MTRNLRKKKSPSVPAKLDRLPQGYRVRKRPLLKPPPPVSSRASPRFYVRADAPFRSLTSRIDKCLRKQLIVASTTTTTTTSTPAPPPSSAQQRNANVRQRLVALEQRSAQLSRNNTTTPHQNTHQNAPPLAPGLGPVSGSITVDGTGRAIAKTLQVAAWYTQRRAFDCTVSVQTRTVPTVDDVVIPPSHETTRPQIVSPLDAPSRAGKRSLAPETAVSPPPHPKKRVHSTSGHTQPSRLSSASDHPPHARDTPSPALAAADHMDIDTNVVAPDAPRPPSSPVQDPLFSWDTLESGIIGSVSAVAANHHTDDHNTDNHHTHLAPRIRNTSCLEVTITLR